MPGLMRLHGGFRAGESAVIKKSVPGKSYIQTFVENTLSFIFRIFPNKLSNHRHLLEARIETIQVTTSPTTV